MAAVVDAVKFSQILKDDLTKEVLEGQEQEVDLEDDAALRAVEAGALSQAHAATVDLSDLDQQLEGFNDNEVIRAILEQGSFLEGYALDVEEKLREVELASIEDYINESDNLVELHTQIRSCDSILLNMETLLGKFQTDLGAISEEIKQLQTQSQSMNQKLNNRRAAEEKLGAFLDDVAVSDDLIHCIVNGTVDEQYVASLKELDQKLQFVQEDTEAKNAAAVNDVEPTLEKLRVKAVARVRDFLMTKVFQLRRPKTNIQIIQTNVLLKYTYFVHFLQNHGMEVYNEVKDAYVETLSKVLSTHFRTYIMAVERLQKEVGTRGDLLGTEDNAVGGMMAIFNKASARATRDELFALGDRIQVLECIDEPALIPHVEESKGRKFGYCAIFRSVHKLLVDTATSEYLFCARFFGEDAVFHHLFAPTLNVVEGAFVASLAELYDIVGVLLMIRVNHHNQLIMMRRAVPGVDSYLDRLNLLLWPRFKSLFDAQIASVRAGNERNLFNNSPEVHTVVRRYTQLAISMLILNAEYRDGQLDDALERLKAAVCDLLLRMSNLFHDKRSGIVFLIQNYNHIWLSLQQADKRILRTLPVGDGISRTATATTGALGRTGEVTMADFKDQLASCTSLYVEDQLMHHFSKMIDFVKKAEQTVRTLTSWSEGKVIPGYGPSQSYPIVIDFKNRWENAVEMLHSEVNIHFGRGACAQEVLKACSTQLLLYYARLLDLLKKQGPDGVQVCREAVSTHSIVYEMKRYHRGTEGSSAGR